MQVKAIAEDVSLAATVDGAATDLANISPFQAGMSVIAVIESSAAADGAPVQTLQTSPDGTTWTTVATKTGIKNAKYVEITLDRYIRHRVTTASTSAGYGSWYLLSA